MLRLERTIPADERPAENDRDGWARFDVLDDEGARVGLVAEEHEWLGDTWGPATYIAVHNPTGAAWGALWRSESYFTAPEALAALAEHLGAAQ